jgi:hypothetical protein
VLHLLDPARSPSTGCSLCHGHFLPVATQFFAELPPTLDAARRWLTAAHNAVNARLDKPELTYEQAKIANNWV